MKHLLDRLGVSALALFLLAFAQPSFAAEATKISFVENSYFYRGGGVEHGNAGFNGGDYSTDVFNGNFTDYRYQNTDGAYLVIDLTPICTDPDGQPFVTDILVGHAGNTKYSLYYTTEDAPAAGSTSDTARNWIPVDGATQVQAGGTKTYGVNAVATAVKYVFDTSLGWGGQSLAEIEVQGYEYVPPKAEKISSRQRAKMYRGGSVSDGAAGNFGINGNDSANNLFDGDFSYCIYQNTAGAYIVVDTTVYENGTSTGDGYYVTDVLIGHAGNAKYSLYYTTEAAPAAGSTSDDRNWIAVDGAQQVQAGGTKTYGVNAIATAVKYVWDTSLGWGGQSLAEIEIWGMDPSTIACLHPNLDSVPWTVVTNSNTCTEFGYMTRACPDCGEEFTTEDSNQPPAHDYVATLTRAGSVAAYGEGYYECSRCHDRVDFSEPANLVTNATFDCGLEVPGHLRFTSLTVSSVWHSDWGIKPTDLIDRSWTHNYTCWTSIGVEGEHCDFTFGAPVDLTYVDIATHNHSHTLSFYSVDDATGTETLIGEQVVVKAESGSEQRFQVPLYGNTVSTHLRLRQVDNGESYSIWGGTGMCIVEMHPYGTIPGANKLKPAVRIGLDGYESIADAIAAVETNTAATVTLMETRTEDVVIPVDKDITIDLNGNSITNVAADTISVYGTLSIIDLIGGGEIVSVLPAKADIVNYPSGTVTIQGGTFAVPDNATYYNIKNMGAMTVGGNATVLSRVSTASTLIANGWYGNAANDRGTIGQANTAILTINGGTFDGGKNVVKNDDYGILTINGGTFRNISENDAVIMNWHETTIVGGAFTGATKVLVNGSYGANSADKGVMTVSGGTFTATAENGTLFGYGLEGGHMADAVITVTGGTFSGAVQGLRDNDGTYGYAYVSGGTFDSPVPEIYCAPGFVPVANEDGGTTTYGVKPVYVVSFVNEKGAAPTNQVYDVVAGVTVFATEPDPAPTATGFTFDGWFAPEATNAWVFATDAVTNDLVLTAGWTLDRHTVAFEWHGGAVTNEYDYGTAAADVAVPRDPPTYAENDTIYTFTGWSAAVPETITADVTITAQYSSAAATARVNGGAYATLAEAIAAAQDGDTVLLLDDVTLDARVEPNLGAGTTLVIDLGGYTITRTGTSGNGSAFDVKSGSVTITNGVVDCTQDDTAIVADGVYAITARAGSAVTLADLAVSVDSECGACVYPFAYNENGSVTTGTITIKSGTYVNGTTAPYRYKSAWTGMAVNQVNKTSGNANNTAGVATQCVFIEGGSFAKVDPAFGDDSWSDDEGTFLAPGYLSVADDGKYTVKPARTVSFTVDGEPYTNIVVASGQTVARPADPVKAACAFTGWTLDGSAYDFASPVTADIELEAAFASLAAATWVGGASGAWDTASNWDIGYIPTKATVVTFTNDVQVGIRHDDDHCKEIVLTDAFVTLVPGNEQGYSGDCHLHFWGNEGRAVSGSGTFGVDNVSLFNANTSGSLTNSTAFLVSGNTTFRGNAKNLVAASFTITGATTLSNGVTVSTIDYATTRFVGDITVPASATATLYARNNGHIVVESGCTVTLIHPETAGDKKTTLNLQDTPSLSILTMNGTVVTDADTCYVKHTTPYNTKRVYEVNRKRTVVSVTATNATVTGVASGQRVAPGEELAIGVTGLAEGYEPSVTITKNADSSVLLTTNAVSFTYTMPDFDIDVAATAVSGEPDPIDLSTETYSAEEIAAGAIPAGVVTDGTSGETAFIVCFHGQAGVTYTLQGTTTLGLDEDGWKSTDLVVGDPFVCTVEGQLVRLEFPMDGENVPDAMFFKIGATRTPAASGD